MSTIKIPAEGQYIKNYSVYMGDTFAPVARIVKSGGVVVDASDWTWKIRIQTEKTGALFVLLTNGSGITFPDGKFQWGLTKAQTATMTPGVRYVYDIQFTRPDDVAKTYQRGIMIPVKDISPA